PLKRWAFVFSPGSDLLSHTVSHAVPSAPKGLTSVFGMGTGVAPSIQPPGKSISQKTEPHSLKAELKSPPEGGTTNSTGHGPGDAKLIVCARCYLIIEQARRKGGWKSGR